jgi:hypothetical protein
VVYEADESLWAVSMNGGPVTLLATGGEPDGRLGGPAFTADGQSVVYWHDPPTGTGALALNVVPVAGGEPVVLTPSYLEPGRYEVRGSRVFFEAYLPANSQTELQVVSVEGGVPVRIHEPLADDVFDFLVSPDGGRVVFRAEAYKNGQVDLLVLDMEPDADGDGILSNCDVCPTVADPAQTDADDDGFGNACDCRGEDPSIYPGAPEVNDGKDNQCPGESGYLLIDETSSASGFFDPSNRDAYAWPPQPGATAYEVVRSDDAGFLAGCRTFESEQPAVVDPERPRTGETYFYLNRALAPFAGSWGRASDGVERLPSCAQDGG